MPCDVLDSVVSRIIPLYFLHFFAPLALAGTQFAVIATIFLKLKIFIRTTGLRFGFLSFGLSRSRRLPCAQDTYGRIFVVIANLSAIYHPRP